MPSLPSSILQGKEKLTALLQNHIIEHYVRNIFLTQAYVASIIYADYYCRLA